MNDYSRHTKAQLIEELDAYREKQNELVRQLDSQPGPPRAVPEAEAIARCVRALDELTKDRRNTHDPFSSFRGGSSEVARVLKMLSEKYNVSLVEVKTEPCMRRHLDEVPDASIRAAIEGSIPNVFNNF